MRWIDILVVFWVGKQLKWYDRTFAMWSDVCDVNFKALLHSKNLVSWFVSGMKSLPYYTRDEMNQFRVLDLTKTGQFCVFWCFLCFHDAKNGRLCQDVEEEVEAKVWCLQLLIRLRRSNFFSMGGTPPTKKFLHSPSRVWEFWRNYPLEDTVDSQPSIFFGGPGTCWSGGLSRWYEENFQTPLNLNIDIKYCHVSHQ